MSAPQIAQLISSAGISNSEIRRAAVHLSKPLRASLFSELSAEHRSASGKFFEALVYEILLAESATADSIDKIAAKLNDAEYQEFDRFTKDGLWYSKDGEILFRVHKKVVAEMDFLVLCKDRTLVFGEVTINPETIPSLIREAEEKKQLLHTLCEQAGLSYTIEFVLVTASYPDIDPELADEDAWCCIEHGNTLWKHVHINEILHKKRAPVSCEKRVDGRLLFH
ncbi:MAG TPA: hypothetical protein O0X50_03675 [Methanocorpusculum sp.]|nr:hypothetical protein [Methanocorpusculum sp.]